MHHAIELHYGPNFAYAPSTVPRKRLIYTSQFPYHITARSNNKEWFKLPQEECWEVFVNSLRNVAESCFLRIHAFVLMSNHYHMVASTTDSYNLGEIMNRLQTNISKTINEKTAHQNHIFGGGYRGSLITTAYYYAHAIKYVYRNPVKAKLCLAVQEYPFSTVMEFLPGNDDKKLLSFPPSQMDYLIPQSSEIDYLEWLNTPFKAEEEETIRKALKKTRFEIASNRDDRFPHYLSKTII